MNDKRRKYAAVVSVPPELLDRYPTSIPRIEEELVYKLTDPIVKETIKGECIVRFTETEQQQDFTTALIAFRKYVCLEAVVRCKDCRYAHMSTDGRVKYCEVWFPDEAEYLDGDNYCSCGERGRKIV